MNSIKLLIFDSFDYTDKKVHHFNKELNYKRQFYFLYEYWMPLTCINILLFEMYAVKLTYYFYRTQSSVYQIWHSIQKMNK